VIQKGLSSIRRFRCLRRAISPLIATIILLIVGLVAASIVMVSDMVGSSDEPTVYKLFFTSVYQVKPVSVDNAGWQLALLVENEGNQGYEYSSWWVGYFSWK
jgi:hypothetical protein